MNPAPAQVRSDTGPLSPKLALTVHRPRRQSAPVAISHYSPIYHDSRILRSTSDSASTMTSAARKCYGWVAALAIMTVLVVLGYIAYPRVPDPQKEPRLYRQVTTRVESKDIPLPASVQLLAAPFNWSQRVLEGNEASPGEKGVAAVVFVVSAVTLLPISLILGLLWLGLLGGDAQAGRVTAMVPDALVSLLPALGIYQRIANG